MGSALRVYLLCLATFGLYGLYWTFRAARRVAGRDRAGAAFWALGSIAAPFACLVLYELSRAARSEALRQNRSGTAAWLAPGLYAALSLLIAYGPLSPLWTPLWLLLPIPLVIVHAQIAKAHGSADFMWPEEVAPARRWGEVAITLVGLPLVGLVSYFLDAAAVGFLRADAAQGAVRGVSGVYELQVDDTGWRQVAPGTIGDADADLELLTRDQQAWLVVYAHSGQNEIDAIVDGRRSRIMEGEALSGFSEKRFLLDSERMIPASIVHYTTGETPLVRTAYLVLTAHLETGIVEAVAFTNTPDTDVERLRSLLEGFRVTGQEAAP